MSESPVSPLDSPWAFAAAFDVIIWSAGSDVRRIARHAGQRCPQRLPRPIGLGGAPMTAVCQQDCESDHALVRQQVYVNVQQKVRRSGLPDNLSAYVRKVAGNCWGDRHRQLAGEVGVVQRPARAVQADWVVAALPDPTDRELLERMLQFAGSEDPVPADAPWPIRRWAERDGVPHVAMELQVAHVLEQLSLSDAAWLDRNLIRPLSRKATAFTPDVMVDVAAGGDTHALAVTAVVSRAERYVTQGEPTQSALQRATGELLGEAAAERLRKAQDFDLICQDLQSMPSPQMSWQ